MNRELIDTLCKKAADFPIQFHLQPLHITVVESSERKKLVTDAVLERSGLDKAQGFIIFAASRNAYKQKEAVTDELLESGSISIDEAEALEKKIDMHFDTTPARLGWIGKLIGAPLIRLFSVMPQLPAVHKREWLTRQTMKQVMVFVSEAEKEGLYCQFIETFDEWRLKLYLGLAWTEVVVSVIAIQDQKPTKYPNVKKENVISWT